ncbi:MAG TPA: hypothetical protein VIU45_09135 [Chitinophagaceae bacterium]
MLFDNVLSGEGGITCGDPSRLRRAGLNVFMASAVRLSIFIFSAYASKLATPRK